MSGNKNARPDLSKSSPLRNPLCVALDVDSRERALYLADELADLVGGFKLGPRLLMRYGASLAQEIAQRAPLFVDCKFFDISSTMVASVRAAFESGASLVTVHALAGESALSDLAKLESELKQKRDFKILAVTILTSWEQNNLPPSLKSIPISEHVRMLAQSVKNSGLSSVVCSAHEISLLNDLGLYLVTPGIRFSLEDHADQKRVMSPHEALRAGSSALVVGRPIIEALKPREAATDYLTSFI